MPDHPTTTIEKIALSSTAQSAITALESAEFEAWAVGGCVRDAILGRPVNDYDIATSAPWREAEHALLQSGFNVHRTGTKHGTITATLDDQALEITTYRTDGDYSDGRHPDGVTFVSTIEEDLARRDFTINALAYHPERGLLDCWGGVDDLRSQTIRAVGDPQRRFREDGLRILRGCRFASQLGFRIEPGTLQAMKSHKMMLAKVSAERITHEMDALLLGDHVHGALMETADVIVAVMPEIAACFDFDQHTPYHVYDVWEHIAWVVQRSPATRLGRWAALFHDIGKPAACFMEGDRAHFYGHANLSAEMAGSIMKRLLMAPKFIEDVLTLVRVHDMQIAATHKSVRRFLARLDGDEALFRALIGLKRADCLAQSELSQPRYQATFDLESALDEVLATGDAYTVKQLSLSGHDIMNLGVQPGPQVGSMLNAILGEVIDGKIPNERAALLAFAEEALENASSV